MPPPYDDVLDADTWPDDGSTFAATYDITGATMQNVGAADSTDEDWWLGNGPGLWAKFEHKDYRPKEATIRIVADNPTGTWRPWVVLFAEQIGFDPAAPDFNLLYWWDDNGGDPSMDWSYELVTDVGLEAFDPGVYTGRFYVGLYDWNGDPAPAGTVDFSVTIQKPEPHYDVYAYDDPGADPGLVVVGGSYVYTTQPRPQDDLVDEFDTTVYDWAQDPVTSWYVRGGNLPPAGKYLLQLESQWAGQVAAAPSVNGYFLQVRQNGKPRQQPASYNTSFYDALSAAAQGWLWDTLDGPPQEIGGADAFTYPAGPPEQNGGPECYSVHAGDVFEFALYRDISWLATPDETQARNLRVRRVRFWQLDTDPVADAAPYAEVPSLPLGATDWSRAGLAGADLRKVRTGTGTSWDEDKHLCVMANGDVYVLANDWHGSPGVTSLRLHHWDGSAWACVAEDVTGHGNDFSRSTVDCERCDVCTDGTYVYCLWGEKDGTSTGGQPNYWWRMVQYDPTTSTLTELGTGQRKDAVRTVRNTYAGYFGNGIHCKCGPDGKVWVGWVEEDDAAPPAGTGFPNYQAYLAYWSGSAWVYLTVPSAPDQRSRTGENTAQYLAYISIDGQYQVDFTFCHHDGPSNWPSAVYNVRWSWATIAGNEMPDGSYQSDEWVYSEYDGSSWGNTLQFSAERVFWRYGIDKDLGGYKQFGVLYKATQSRESQWQQGLALTDDGARVYLGAAYGDGGGIDRILAMRLRADGTAFEPWPDDYMQPDYLGRLDFRGTSGGGGNIDNNNAEGNWIDPTGWDAVWAQGTMWVISSTNGSFGGLALYAAGEDGCRTGWVYASPQHSMVGVYEAGSGFSRIAVHPDGSKVYILVDSPWAYDGCTGVWEIPVHPGGVGSPVPGFVARVDRRLRSGR